MTMTPGYYWAKPKFLKKNKEWQIVKVLYDGAVLRINDTNRYQAHRFEFGRAINPHIEEY